MPMSNRPRRAPTPVVLAWTSIALVLTVLLASALTHVARGIPYLHTPRATMWWGMIAIGYPFVLWAVARTLGGRRYRQPGQ
jgi:hypothetical protein